MPAVIEISHDTREILIRALRAYRVHADAQGEAQVTRSIDDTVEDLITGRARLLRGTDAAWRELGVSR